MDWIKKASLITAIVFASGLLIYATSTESKNKITKAELGHLEKTNLLSLKYLKEYKVKDVENFKI